MRRPLCYICMAFVVSVYIYLSICPVASGEFTTPEGDRVTIQGKVYHKEYKNNSLLIYVKVSNDISNIFQIKNKKEYGIIAYVADNKEPKLGSVVEIKGKLENFKKARNPGSFDQRLYYNRQDIYFKLSDVSIFKESKEYSRYYESLFQLRLLFEKALDTVFDKEDASIMKAMLLGNKNEMEPTSKQLYQKSGVAHILAISGLHISIIGMGLYRILRRIRIPQPVAAIVAVTIMICYGDMTGMSSSAFRAIFMFGMKLTSELIHRTYDMLTALAVSAVWILFEQPLYIYHSGFLLSYGAIFGIGCMLDVIKSDMTQMSFSKKHNTKQTLIIKYIFSFFLNSLSSGLSIFIIHFPIILSIYYEYPVYSMLINLIIIPGMGLLMILGTTGMMLGFIGLLVSGVGGHIGILIAKLIEYGCHFILNLYEHICMISLELPNSTWITGRPDTWRIICYYIIVIYLFVTYRYSRDKTDSCVRIPRFFKFIMTILAVTVITSHSYGGLTLTFVDVGQGDGIWIENEKGHHYLIDGGSTSEKKLYEYTLLPYLKYADTSYIEGIFLTHLDDDHISGVMELIKNNKDIKIGRIILAYAVVKDDAYNKLVGLCDEKGIELMCVSAGDVLKDGKLVIEVLHPQKSYVSDSRNACSLVVKLEYEKFHALLTGDVEADGERMVLNELMSNESWTCNLYKAAHHGSRYSNTYQLVEYLHPQIAIISCGERNNYGHPHAETLERLEGAGSKVLRTDKEGAITVNIRNGMVKIRTFYKE